MQLICSPSYSYPKVVAGFIPVLIVYAVVVLLGKVLSCANEFPVSLVIGELSKLRSDMHNKADKQQR